MAWRKINKRWLGVGAGVLLLILISRCHSSPEDASGPVPTAQVERQSLVLEVKASGEIQARESNRIVPKIKRQAVVSFLIPEGARVEEEEVVARFATDEIERRVRDAEGTLAQAELKVVSTRTELDIQILENSNTLKIAEQAVSDAKLELEKFREGDRGKDVRAADLAVSTSESRYERSIKKYHEAQSLLEEGFMTEDQVEEERIAMETAEVDAETARLEVKILAEYDLPLRLAKAENALSKALTELEKTRKKNDVQLRSREQEYQTALVARDRAQADLDELQKELENHVVKAPTQGVVTYGDPNNPWRRGDVQVGMNLNPGEVLLTIPDMRVVQAVVNVPEALVDQVKVGQPASVAVDALPGRTFRGTVALVAEIANPSGWISSDVKEFKVEIPLDTNEGLRPGFSCRADIETGRIDDTLALPVQALFRQGERWGVYLARNSSFREVEVGRSSMTHAEIISGLNAGDEVRLTAPEPNE